MHYWIADAWPSMLSLLAALLSTGYLAYSYRRLAKQYREELRRAINDSFRTYARGRTDGLREGLELGKNAADRSFRKADFEHGRKVGYDQAMLEALEAVSAQDAERQQETTRAFN